jgi:hypothetical protein
MLVIFELYLKVSWGNITYFNGSFDGQLHILERWWVHPDVLVYRLLEVDLGAFLPRPGQPPLPRVVGSPNLVEYV